MRTIGRLVLAGLGLFASAGVGSAAEGNVLLVLDASGSMAGRLEGKPKIEIAQQVLADLLGSLPPHIAVGLEAYGHRRDGDCADIEVLAPVGSQGPAQLQSAVRALRPRGKTPITRALGVAADQVSQLRGPANIVLVSDGEETCGGDPCALVKKLRGQGTAVTFYVVGFDVAAAERGQLQCIAEAGGGTYFGADSAAGLSKALAAVQEKVVQVSAGASTVDSAFERDAEGWKVVGDARLDRSVDPALEDGALKAVDSATGGVWYWQAPASFLGDRSSAYGRELRFRLRATPIKEPFNAADVVLEGTGIALVFDTPQNPGVDWTEYRVPLAAGTGWKHRGTGAAASARDMRVVLGQLQTLLIRGEFNTGRDTGWLDDVVFGAPR